jgi:hypothetical protein
VSPTVTSTNMLSIGNLRVSSEIFKGGSCLGDYLIPRTIGSWVEVLFFAKMLSMYFMSAS